MWDETLFTSLAQARVAIALGRADYNTARPHSQLAWQTPAEFASTFNPRRSLALRYAKAPRQRPSLHPPSRAQPTPETNKNCLETGSKVTR
ncbi:integrase core domain-containing protein [Mesorhizobium muleiense]|uniref:integrase core domain-containing protein n=1 Tax=Mesorhizobium muleiense TaxID=1004279 RepID=UPI003AFB50A5